MKRITSSILMVLLAGNLALAQCEEQGFTFLHELSEIDPNLAADWKDLYLGVFSLYFERTEKIEKLTLCERKMKADMQAKSVLLSYATFLRKTYKKARDAKKLDAKTAHSIDSLARVSYPEVYPIFKSYLEKRRGHVLQNRDK